MNYIIEKDQYLQVLAAWKRSTNHTAIDHVIYNVLRGFDSNRGFTPITKEIKLANGAQAWSGYQNALSGARHILREPITTFSKYDTDVSIARKKSEYEYIHKMLQDKFGINFAPELMTKLREELK